MQRRDVDAVCNSGSTNPECHFALCYVSLAWNLESISLSWLLAYSGYLVLYEHSYLPTRVRTSTQGSFANWRQFCSSLYVYPCKLANDRLATTLFMHFFFITLSVFVSFLLFSFLYISFLSSSPLHSSSSFGSSYFSSLLPWYTNIVKYFFDKRATSDDGSAERYKCTWPLTWKVNN